MTTAFLMQEKEHGCARRKRMEKGEDSVGTGLSSFNVVVIVHL